MFMMVPIMSISLISEYGVSPISLLTDTYIAIFVPDPTGEDWSMQSNFIRVSEY